MEDPAVQEMGGVRAAVSVRSLLSTVASSSVIVVAILFSIGTLLSEIFYRRFGVAAKAVGMSTADLVTQAGVSALWLVLLAGPGVVSSIAFVWANLRRKRSDRAVHIHAAVSSAFVILVPVGAMNLFGDIGRLGDWGIPSSAMSLGIVSVMTSSLAFGVRDGVYKFTDGFRGEIGKSILLGVAWFLGGATLGVFGTLIDASDAKKGNARVGAPWSLSPSTRNVQVTGVSDTGLPVDECLVLIGRGSGGALLWDPEQQQLWQTDMSLSLVGCVDPASEDNP